MNGRAWNLTNRRFGRLVALKRIGQSKDGHYTWLCRCDCGGESVVLSKNLLNGNTKSCGCLRHISPVVRQTTHGESKTRLFKIWANMIQRCTNPNAKRYHRYGGRGIRVCDEWSDYAEFAKWAKSSGYRNDLTIDRIDNDGIYEPLNCRWADWKMQSENRSRTHHFTFNGETHTLHEWADKMCISYDALRTRYYMGFSPERMFAEAVK